MNKHIKKKHFTWAVINEIYYYVKEQHEKGYDYITIDKDMWNDEHGFIPIVERYVRTVTSFLRKDGYVVSYSKFIPRKLLGRTGWCFFFSETMDLIE